LDAIDVPFGDVENEPGAVLSFDLDGARHSIPARVGLELRREDVGVRIPLVLDFRRQSCCWLQLHGDVHAGLLVECVISFGGRAIADPKARMMWRFVDAPLASLSLRCRGAKI